MLFAIAVYGTLRAEGSNHQFMGQSRFIRAGRTDLPFAMFDLGQYPALVQTQDLHSIFVELYQIDEQTLAALDQLEEYPQLYDRKPVRVGDRTAIIYYCRKVNPDWPPIPEGDWIEYVKKRKGVQM